MGNLINKAISSTYNQIGKWNEVLNGPDPRFFSYKVNGKDTKPEKLKLNSYNCHSFIGKMRFDGSGTYSDEVITALIKYFFDHTHKGDSVVIELANIVSEILNGKESNQDCMNFEEQKKHILELAKKVSKNRAKDLEIVDIKDNNKRLFSVLEKEGLSGLDCKGILPDLNKGFDSLDIAKHLYYVAKNDNDYFKSIKNLKTNESKKVSGDSDYYGLIEIAIRINSLLHGIDKQGGVARQKKYDELLLKHINPNIKDFPLLSDFQNFCWEHLKGTSFKGLYFDTKESEMYLNKIDKKRDIESKIKKLLIGVFLVGVSASGGGIATYNYMNNKEKEEKERIKTELRDKDIKDSLGSNIYVSSAVLDHLEDLANNSDILSDIFVSLYGDENISKEGVNKEIYKYLEKESKGQYRFQEISKNPNDKLIQYNCIKDFIDGGYKYTMIDNGFTSIEHQSFLKGLESDFINTLEYDGQIKEGYNEKEKAYYHIVAAHQIDKPQGIKGLDDTKLVSGYMIKHKCKIDSIILPEHNANDYLSIINQMGSDYGVKILSKSNPDKDGNVTIKRSIIDDSDRPSVQDLIKTGKKLIFVIRDESTSLGDNRNLVVDKSTIVYSFMDNNPIVKKFWDTYDARLPKAHYMGKAYNQDPIKTFELMKSMVIDFYKYSRFSKPDAPISTDVDIEQYIEDFQHRINQ